MQSTRVLFVLSVVCFSGAVAWRLAGDRTFVALKQTPSIAVDGQSKSMVCDATENGTLVTFELRNVGTSELSIAQVQTCCGCIVESLQRDRIAPSERTTLSLRVLNVRSGMRRFAVRVESNDPEMPTLTLAIMATGRDKPPFLGPVQHSTLHVHGDIDNLGTAKVRFETVEPAGQHLWITGAYARIDGLTCRVKQSNISAYDTNPDACVRAYELEVAMNGDCAFGLRHGVVEVMANSERIFDLPVTVERKRPFSLTPDRLSVRFDPATTKLRRELVLTTNVPCAVKSVTSKDAWIECHKPDGVLAGNRRTITITVTRPQLVGVVEGNVVVEVDAGKVYRLDVPVLAFTPKAP